MNASLKESGNTDMRKGGGIGGIMNMFAVIEVKLFFLIDWNQLLLLYRHAAVSP